MRTSVASKSLLPLIEMVIAVVILTLSCVIMLYMFLIARSTGLLARDITEASLCAQSVTERLKATDSPARLEQTLLELFDGGTVGDSYIIRYDGDWNEVRVHGEYTLSLDLFIEEKERGVFYSINITVNKDSAYPFLEGEEKQRLADFHNARYMSYVRREITQ